MRNIWTATIVAALLVTQAHAQGISGSAVLSGVEHLGVPRCRNGKRDATVTVTADPDGTWHATEGGHAYEGTYVVAGKGRVLKFTVDDASLASLVAQFTPWVDTLCGFPVTVTKATLQKGVFKLNKPLTSGKLTLVYRLTGTAHGGRGHARASLVAKGPWQPAT